MGYYFVELLLNIGGLRVRIRVDNIAAHSAAFATGPRAPFGRKNHRKGRHDVAVKQIPAGPGKSRIATCAAAVRLSSRRSRHALPSSILFFHRDPMCRTTTAPPLFDACISQPLIRALPTAITRSFTTITSSKGRMPGSALSTPIAKTVPFG